MRTYKVLSIILMASALSACNGDDKPFVDQEPVVAVRSGEIVKGISVTLSDFESADAKSRTAYSDVDGGVKVTWAEGDTIGIFPNVGGQVEFPIQAGTASNEAEFDGGGWALRASSTYAAYYPFNKANVYRDNETILLDYTGQTQASNGSTTHLGQFDYQATGGVQTNSNGYLNFQFKHLGALIQFKLTVPKAGTYTSLTMTSSEKVFVTKAELDISGNEPLLKSTEKSNTITLSLKNIELISDNAVLTGYMMLAPVDLSQGSLELTINGDEFYTITLVGQNVEGGKQYIIEKTPDGIIDFADENVKTICIKNWDTNGDGELSYGEAAAVTDIGHIFSLNKKIKSFDEFQYFTGVTSIGIDAFADCSSLASIVMPESLTSIGDVAFYGCSSLTSIVIPEGVTSIASYPFEACSSLTSIRVDKNNRCYDSRNDCNAIIETNTNALISGCVSTIIPSSVTSILDFAFYGCSSLKSIDIPENLTSIGRSAFGACSSLAIIEIPEGVTSIGDYAFEYCSSLTNFVIPKGVTSIGCGFLRDCTSLTSILIPKGVISIDGSAFEGCSRLTSIVVDENNGHYDSRDECNAIIETKSNTLIVGCASTVIPSSVTSIGNHAFSRNNRLYNILIPESVTSIGDWAFYYSSLIDIVIPESVTSIGNASFSCCRNLKSISIPESVTSIGRDAFTSCNRLNSIVIPNSVEIIGNQAFSSCPNLTNFTCLATSPPTLGSNAFSSTRTTIYVPASSVDTYKVADGWSQYADRIQAIPE